MSIVSLKAAAARIRRIRLGKELSQDIYGVSLPDIPSGPAFHAAYHQVRRAMLNDEAELVTWAIEQLLPGDDIPGQFEHRESWFESDEERELPGSEIKVGHCVIVNEIDRPTPSLVAAVTSISGGFVRCRYLSRSLGRSDEAVTSSPTPILEFGVKVLVKRGIYRCEVVGGSAASYGDGSPRNWQQLAQDDARLVDPTTLKIIENAYYESQLALDVVSLDRPN